MKQLIREWLNHSVSNLTPIREIEMRFHPTLGRTTFVLNLLEALMDISAPDPIDSKFLTDTPPAVARAESSFPEFMRHSFRAVVNSRRNDESRSRDDLPTLKRGRDETTSGNATRFQRTMPRR